jgi:universal stress protein E
MIQELGKILVVLDREAGPAAALGKAAALAAGSGAKLRLFCCDHDPRLVARLFLSPESLTAARVAFLRQLRAWLLELAGPLQARGLVVEVEAAWDAPHHEGVLREVGLCRPDLVVMSTEWSGGLKRSLFSSGDWQLLRTCPVPLLLVKPVPWSEPVRIAAAIDPGHPDDAGSVLDHTIVRAACAFGEWLAAGVSVVHVFTPLDPALEVTGGAGLRQAAQAAMQALLQPHRLPAGSARLLEGDVRRALPEYAAANGIDVLVVGSISRSRLQGAVIGSTAERLLDRVPSDLLAVRARRSS